MITRDEFAKEELIGAGLPPSTNNVQSLVVWMTSEDTMAEWNPQATTQPMPGATDFNSVGVKNYPDQAIGLQAFSTTLRNGDYGAIINCLERSAVPAETCSAITNSPWGSKPSPELVAEVLTNWVTYASVIIPGSDNTPAPTPEPTPEPIPVPNPTECEVQVPILKNGNTGPAVKNVQLLLNDQIGSHLVLDGIFGQLTEDAVKACQTFWHGTVDGIVGPQTWSALVNF